MTIPDPPERRRWSFNIGTIMAVIAVVAAMLAARASLANFGILGAVPALIALAWTISTSSGRTGRRYPLLANIAAFAAAFVVVIVIAWASAFAFVATCTVVAAPNSRRSMGLGYAGGAVAGLAVLFGLTAAILRLRALKLRDGPPSGRRE